MGNLQDRLQKDKIPLEVLTFLSTAFKIQMNPPKSANLENGELLLGLPFSLLWDYTYYD